MSKRLKTLKKIALLCCSISAFLPFAASAQPVATESYERAVVEKRSFVTEETPDGNRQVEKITVRFLGGPLDGQVKDISNEREGNPYALRLEPQNHIVVFVQTNSDGTMNYFIEGYDRRAALLWLTLLFVAVLVILAGWQGVKVAASIAISILLIVYVLIPSFVNGLNPVPIAIVLAGVFTLISTGFATGWNAKTAVTVIGTMGGVLVAYLIAYPFSDWTHLNGLSTEEDRLFFAKNNSLDPRGLLFAGIIIAAVGVVEDVAVSIASGVWEVHRAKPNANRRELFSSGMVIGRDHMSALANTLVFAYVGSSLSSLLLYQEFKSSWLKFINFDVVGDEILRSLTGTIGLIFTVPITAFLAAWAIHRWPNSGQIHSQKRPHIHG